MATREQYVHAGELAADSFDRLRSMLHSARTQAQHELEDEILDAALMEAGIIPRPDPASVLIGATSLVGQTSPEFPGEAI